MTVLPGVRGMDDLRQILCLGDKLAADHYRNLEKHAGDCVQCGHCDSRCPFGVAQSARMQEIAAYFGE